MSKAKNTTVTIADLEKKISEVKQIDVLNELNNESEDQTMASEKEAVLTEIFNNDPYNLLDVSESEDQPMDMNTVNTEKTLNDLIVGDQVLLVHTVRGKVSKELKEITDKNTKALKIGSLQFDPVSGFGRSGVSEGKRIFIPTQSDLDAMQESKAKSDAFSEAKFKLLELSSMLESSQASSQALKDFTYQVDMLASSLL